MKTPGAIAVPTVRNERAFLVTVVGTTSVLAVAAGQLPGDWVSDRCVVTMRGNVLICCSMHLTSVDLPIS